ncbi:MAG: DPP IV N-terminal domain-containing protein [Gemmatirosa sp.]|nr:DPP IV N-terminal domain-containing protein [Gemmatirosa sp.]
MAWNVTPLVTLPAVRPTWLPDGRFWYRNVVAGGGSEFVLVDPARGTRTRAFDHGRLAAGLTAAGAAADSARLPFTAIDLAPDGKSMEVDVGARRLRCDLAGYRCEATGAARAAASPDGGRFGGAGRGGSAATSPNGKLSAFIRDWNLWLRDLATGQERQLTNDGVKDFGYATDNAGWTKSDRPILLWSPDSKRIATFQQDDRKVGEMYVVQSKVGHPTLEAWKYPLPGDSVVSMIHRVVIDVDGPKVTRLQMAPDYHRSTLCDHITCGGGFADIEWMDGGARLVFASTSRDHRREDVRVADASTGAVRDVFTETVKTFFESGSGSVNWHVLPNGELLWFSERDDWGNLYVYDLATGALKRQVTKGPGTVLQVVRIDSTARALWFTAAGREAGRDPYFKHLYRVSLDGKAAPTLITPEDGDHTPSLSPDGRYVVDSWSRPEVPPTTVVRDARTGKLLATLEKSDISRLVATGWTPPMPFTVKARDGKTDLYGLMFRPTNFVPSKKYPIVNQIYPGPQTGSVGSRSFSAARGDARSLAELGFIVIQLDAMGTPMRSKSFHDAYYADMGDNGLPDQIAGMKQLAGRYPWIDIDRAGIWGHSGGGFAAADAILRYPDFFKVAISEAGNHDQREYEDDWGEKYHGLLAPGPNGVGTNYDDQANQHLAKNLKGKLLIAHGTADDNVPPYNTLLLVDELIKANKDFDLLMLPNRRHGFGNEPYMIRRRWDYFVKNLLGAEPPVEYQLQRAPNRIIP